MLQNNRLRLRAPEPEDLDLLYAWENDTSIWEEGITHSSFSRFALREFLANTKFDIYEDKSTRFMITLCENETTVGCLDLFDFDIHNQKIELAVLIDPAFQRKGIAYESIDLLLEYTFAFLQIRQIYVYVSENNEKSIALFHKLGFQESGKLKQWKKTINGYADVFVFQKLNEQK